MTMQKDQQLTMRISVDYLNRAQALIPLVQQDPAASVYGRISRASILRLAMLKGLELLEEKYGPLPAPVEPTPTAKRKATAKKTSRKKKP